MDLEDDNYLENNEQDRDWEENSDENTNSIRENREFEIDGMTPSEKR